MKSEVGRGEVETFTFDRGGKCLEASARPTQSNARRRIRRWCMAICAAVCLFACGIVAASDLRGLVVFNGAPIPGATVTATQGDQKVVTVTDGQGVYTFSDLASGAWSLKIEMAGFAPMTNDVSVGANMPPPPAFELKMLGLDEVQAQTMLPALPAASAPPGAATTAAAANGSTKTGQPGANAASDGAGKVTAKNDTGKPQDGGAGTQPGQTQQAKPAESESQPEEDQRAADGFLINGSTNNGAASPFAQLAAFGNDRRGGRGLYNGGFGVIVNNSALNASPYSLSGFNTPKPSYNQVTAVVNIGGPIRIPHLMRNGPTFFVGYQWTRNTNATTQSALVPTNAERNGDLSQSVNSFGQPLQIFNPATGLQFAGNQVPVSVQAAALLKLYPSQNVFGNSRFNFQTPIVSNTHQDALNSRLTKQFGRRDNLNGGYAFQSTRTGTPNLFNFLDASRALGMNANANWSHRFGTHYLQTVGFRFSRQATQLLPFWANVQNISGDAGITGNNQQPINWGPPALSFLSSGIAGLSDQNNSHDRFQTSSVSYSMLWNRRNHNITVGGDFRRQEFNYLSQQDPRGQFTFTGAATASPSGGGAAGGSDFADFLLGVPDTSAIAFGNADKYFRENVYDAYANDDWRVNPELTVNYGVRWEYGAPITELFDRLVNLDIAPGFTAIAPVLASGPVGSVTGQSYPNSLVRPDRGGVEPRFGFSWRPISGSSMVVRGGYGVNYDTSVYQNIALQMAQQAPLSISARVQNSSACPLTLANGFNTCPSTSAASFAIDPNFQVGYVQTWQLSVQRDLPWSLQLSVKYLGNKGTRGLQEFLPNTYPAGAVNPCPTCPVGFAFLTSNGNSTRNAGDIQVRRRLHNGLTATVQYTYSKSIDDDSGFGGQGSISPNIAQNWLDLRAERGRSIFDQRHLLNTVLQYTTGQGLGGKTLMSGWRAAAYKEWTFLSQINLGSGLPQTPIFPGAVTGTGFTASLRPDGTGAPLYAAPAGFFLNPGAFAAPAPGQWGNASRDSITGPMQFTFNASLARTFRLSDRFNLDVRVDSTNPINHVTYTSWYVNIGSPLFGLPATANGMRTFRITSRVRF